MVIVNDTAFAAGLLAVKAPPHGEALTIIVKGTFDIGNGRAAVTAAEQRALSADIVEDTGSGPILRYEDDFAPFKARADLLLVGQDQPSEAGTGRVSIGAHRANLADFGPLRRDVGRRTELAGPDGGDWFATHWPRLSADYPREYFNAAQPEMQFAEYLKGDETIALEGLHPSYDIYTTQLPGLRVRAFVHRADDSFVEAALNLDTLWLDIQAETLVLVWRGMAPINPGWTEGTGEVLIVKESMDQAPRPAAAYRERLFTAGEAEAEPEPPQIDQAMAEADVSSADMPTEVLAFLRDPDAGGDALKAVPGLAEVYTENPKQTEAVGAAAFSEQLQDAGIPATELPADAGMILADPAAAALPPDLGNALGVGTADSGTSEADSAALEAALPTELHAYLADISTGAAGLIGLLRSTDTPGAQLLVKDVGAAPPAQAPEADLAKAMSAVPDWPARSPEDATAIRDLTAAFGHGRPPDGDGAEFLVVLNGFADDEAARHDEQQASDMTA